MAASPSLRLFPAVLLTFLALFVTAARADLVVKEPYLVFPGDAARMTLLWQLSATDTAVVEWGPDSACAQGRAVTSELNVSHQHAYTFDGLAPATRTWYRVTSQGTPYRGSFVSAARPDSTRLEFLAYGDTRSYPSVHNTVAAGMLAALAADSALQTFALFMGDAVANGTLESAWTNEFFSPTHRSIRTLMARVPLAGCMGNHETYGGGDSTLFRKYFPLPFVRDRYYSFDWGPAHVAVLDQYVSYAAGSPQVQWLVADLASSPKPWKFVVLHEPGWSAGGGHANNTTVQNLLQPLFVRYGVSLVFAGHNHYYARATTGGVRHLTLGGGGAPLAVPNLSYPNVNTAGAYYHFATIAIDGAVLKFKALATDLGVIDSFTVVRDVTPPAVVVTSPAGGESWEAGTVHPVQWTASDASGVALVDLRWSADDGLTFPNLIASGVPNTGSTDWQIPGAPTTTARLQVAAHDSAGNLGVAISPAPFTLHGYVIEASAGAGGGIVPAGLVRVAAGATQVFSIRPDSGCRVVSLTIDGVPQPPDTSFTFPSIAANHAIAAAFADTAPPAVTVTAPVGGETWFSDETRAITWLATDNLRVDSVTVEWTRYPSTGPWVVLAHGLPNSGTFAWVVWRPGADSARVRVTAYDGTAASASAASPGTFRIVDPLAGVEPSAARVLALARPRPDPSTGSATLAFTLPAAGHARLEIRDVAGRRLWSREADLAAGAHAWSWGGDTLQGARVAAGRYYVRLVTPWGTRTERLSRLR